MSIYTYFTDTIIHTIFPDVKRVRPLNPKANATLLYTEELKQIIYIRESKNKQALRIRDLRKYNERAVRNMRQLMKNKFGKKRGIKLYNEADKINVLVVERTLNTIWRLHRALNRLDNSATYNKKTIHMIFDKTKTKIPEEKMASLIYKSLYTKFDRYKENIETSMKKKNKGKDKDKQIKPFNELKEKLESLDWTVRMLNHEYCKLAGKTLIPRKLKSEIDFEMERLHKASIIKNDKSSIKYDKEPYKANTEVQ